MLPYAAFLYIMLSSCPFISCFSCMTAAPSPAVHPSLLFTYWPPSANALCTSLLFQKKPWQNCVAPLCCRYADHYARDLGTARPPAQAQQAPQQAGQPPSRELSARRRGRGGRGLVKRCSKRTAAWHYLAPLSGCPLHLLCTAQRAGHGTPRVKINT